MVPNMKQTSQGASEGKPRVILPYLILLGIPLMIIMFNFDTNSKWAHNSARDIYYTFNPEAKRQAEEKWEKWRRDNVLYKLLAPYVFYDAHYVKEYGLYELSSEQQKEAEKSIRYTAEAWDKRGIMPYLELAQIDKIAYQVKLNELVLLGKVSDEVKNYLLKGASSGLSVTDMSYDQLEEFSMGITILDTVGDSDYVYYDDYYRAACLRYYRDEGDALKRAEREVA